MIDLLCLLEFSWIVVWLTTRTRQKALLYSTGAFTAGVVSAQLSDWLTHLFVPPTSHVFQWVESHILTDVHSVALHSFIAPEPAGLINVSHNQWLAYSLLTTLFFVALTVSIFLAFIIIGQLVTALWDRTPTSTSQQTWRPLNLTLGVLSGAYLTFLSALAIGNLAWIRTLSGLGTEVSPSLTMHLTALTLNWLKVHSIG